MNLTEEYKNRIKKLAGVKMLNEDVNPYFGFYDMANGNSEVLIDLLNTKNVDYSYDENRNYIVIQTDQVYDIIPLMNEAGVYKMDSDKWENAFEDPNDCLLLRAKSAPNVPKGAYL